jgi:predicted nucleic acid-binding protein
VIVVDASAVLEVLLQTPNAAALEDRLFAPGESLHAPQLLDVEVTQVLRRYAHADLLSPRRAREALDDLLDFPIARYPHAPFMSRAWELKDNLTAYDAVYVALAEGLQATLLTRDARLAKAPGLTTRVTVI